LASDPGESWLGLSSTGTKEVIVMRQKSILKPWRDVIAPHHDVAAGRTHPAEFAADFAQVLTDRASIEYQDPVEFFKRTYLTGGMQRLLITAVRRISGKGGQPVIKLQTAFGGGKTHSMLAIYHLLSGKASSRKLQGIEDILAKSEVSTLPTAAISVLVGTDLDSTKPKTWKGITVNTLWGMMAAQIGGTSAYELIKVADEKRAAPGAETLVELLDKFGPCIILIDELVAYMRNIYGVDGLPAGSFDSNMTFIHALTEAVKRSKNSLLVASITESNIEIGGTAGKAVLDRIDAIFNRVKELWEPVKPLESFEIVRRRLFLHLTDEDARDETCRAFSELYSESNSDFPADCKERAYFERMKAAYPIHPEVFDRLYDDWGAIEGFQRTRGVLRLMAFVIHELWDRGDKSLMIMPGTLPLDSPKVRDELVSYLSDEWHAVMDKDVDGERSEPRRIDQENSRLGNLMAARRVSRTIFMGSAPSVDAQKVRGIEDVRIRLGVVQPGEQISVFNDALGRLLDHLTHLYSGNKRYWFDTQPNLRRTVADRASRLEDYEVIAEAERRLMLLRTRGEFHAVHVCPSSDDVLDEQETRLVVLSLTDGHKQREQVSPAIKKCIEILDNRGGIPRQFKNMLLFVAPDSERAENLKHEIREYLAWNSVWDDRETLNLDAYQMRQAQENTERTNETVNLKLQDTYCWLLTPAQEGTGPIIWTPIRLASGNSNYVDEASRKLKDSEQLITKWSPAPLKVELDRWFWKDQTHIGIKKLWGDLSRYLYLPRLKDSDVLLDAIREGIKSKDYFGYASSFDSDKGRFLGLVFNSTSNNSVLIDSNSILVKPEAAVRQISGDNQLDHVASYEAISSVSDSQPKSPVQNQDVSLGISPADARLKKRFFGSIQLNPMRLGRDADRVAEEIVQYLNALMDAKVDVTLEIKVEVQSGVPDNIVRTINENCRELKFRQYSFEEY
jgi:predicted AAA+ superfamily ATPase